MAEGGYDQTSWFSNRINPGGFWPITEWMCIPVPSTNLQETRAVSRATGSALSEEAQNRPPIPVPGRTNPNIPYRKKKKETAPPYGYGTPGS